MELCTVCVFSDSSLPKLLDGIQHSQMVIKNSFQFRLIFSDPALSNSKIEPVHIGQQREICPRPFLRIWLNAHWNMQVY